MDIISLLALLVVGAILVAMVAGVIRADRRSSLPRETRRDIDRLARRPNVRTAREQGVRVVDRREFDMPRLGEPPSFLPSVESFDKEHTQP